ncbi:MAG: DUF2148 domain-containing protein [Thermodesulfobacteriota bacterium]
MALIDGREFAQEELLHSAGIVLNAYYKAPLVTSRLEQKAMIVYGEEMAPMFELIEVIQGKMGIDATKAAFFPLYLDYICYKRAMENGYPPIMLILGANLAKADLGWDCGACGFPTCAEFLKYCKDHAGLGRIGVGPSCAWKSVDFGIACDYACAAAWELNIENRIQGTFGLVASLLGYLDDSTATLALPIGPPKEFWWYNRPVMTEVMGDYDQLMQFYRNNYTLHYQMFSSDIRPSVKSDGPWWEKEREFVSVGPDKAYTDYQKQVRAIFVEALGEVKPKVDALKKKIAAKQK